MSNDSTIPDSKRCTKCGEEKPREMFNKGKGKDGLGFWCRHCKRSPETIARINAKLSIPPNHKHCSKCHEIKPVETFSKSNRRDGYCSSCKKCNQTPGGKAIEQERNSWPKGHKRCTKCKEIRLLEMFRPSKAYRDGRTSWCKYCSAAAILAHYRKDKANYISRPHGQPKSRKEIARAFDERNPGRRREQQRAYSKRNPEKHAINQQRRRARIAGLPGRGITVADMHAMIYVQMGLCAYCERDGQKLTLDHIIPVDQGGPHDPENACMCCKKCNSSKGDRTPDEWEEAGRWFDPPKRK